MKLRRCHGVLVRNDAHKSAVSEIYVCMWCGSTYDAGSGHFVGQRCTQKFDRAIRGNPFDDLVKDRIVDLKLARLQRDGGSRARARGGAAAAEGEAAPLTLSANGGKP